MIICIFSSLDFVNEIIEISNELTKNFHTVLIPPTADMIRQGATTYDVIQQEKITGDIVNRTIRQDSIRQSYLRMSKSDLALVLNYTKKGIDNYIGGNTFLEIGFAHILNKPIFLLNPVPHIHYEHEILAMSPFIINGDLSKI